MTDIRYISTRGGSQNMAERLTFEEVMLSGLARDGGLYLPESWPAYSPEDLESFKTLPYADLAARIIAPFVGNAFSPEDLLRLSRAAYATFDHPDVVPIKQLPVDNLHLMELFHGPTLAFKDVALQLLGRMLEEILTRSGKRARIVGATSGDTGSAAIEAVRGSRRVDIFMLHPQGRTSEVQRRQMTTVLSPNVHNVAIAGTFDDCQDLAKACFNDLAFRDHHRLTAVNSINWARVMAQIVYYTAAAVRLGSAQRPVSFCVPTGNFGNIYAAYAAKQMGAPIGRLIIATNTNDILARFIESGAQTMAQVEATLSPSMDIQVSSNFERLLFDLFDRDGRALAKAMASFRASGTMRASSAQLLRARGLFDAGRLDDAGTLAAMSDCLKRFGETIDPHTAVGYVVAGQHRRDPAVPMVVLATAHPAKFPDAVEKATGVRPPLPARLGDLMDRAERVDGLRNDIDELKAMIDDRRAMAAAPATRSKVRT